MYHLDLRIRDTLRGHTFPVACRLEAGKSNTTFELPGDLGTIGILSEAQRIQLVLGAAAPLRIFHARLGTSRPLGPDTRVFMNGWQSWTDSREFAPSEAMETLPRWKQLLLWRYHFWSYGDYSFVRQSSRKGMFHGHSYTYARSGSELELMASLDEDSAFTVFYHDTRKGRLDIERDCGGRELQGGQSFTLFDLGIWKGTEDAVFDAWFAALPKRRNHKAAPEPKAGWTSWYDHYEDINQDVVLKNLEAWQHHGPRGGMIQIDDGYQTAVGDWLSVDRSKFPGGLEALVKSIHGASCKAGLWLAPFAAQFGSALAMGHPDWLLTGPSGRPLVAGSNWGGFYALDIRKAPVQAYLKEVFRTVIHDWGFDLVKLDFLYAACLMPGPQATRGELMALGMELLREWVGDALILGCGVPLASAFGRVDYCRIGCDMGLDWEEPWYMKHLHRERVSTHRSIVNTLGRRHLDGRAFLNDPDVFILRSQRNTLTPEQKKVLFFVNTLFGSLCFCSDDVSAYQDAEAVLFGGIETALSRRVKEIHQHQNGIVEVIFEQQGGYGWGAFNLSAHTLPLHPVLDASLSPRNLKAHELITHTLPGLRH